MLPSQQVGTTRPVAEHRGWKGSSLCHGVMGYCASQIEMCSRLCLASKTLQCLGPRSIHFQERPDLGRGKGQDWWSKVPQPDVGSQVMEDPQSSPWVKRLTKWWLNDLEAFLGFPWQNWKPPFWYLMYLWLSVCTHQNCYCNSPK